MNYFSLIPKELFFTINGEGYIKQYKNQKLLLLADYLYIHTNRHNISYLVLEDILSDYNLFVDRHSNKIITQFKDGLNVLIKLNLIKLIDNNIKIKNITLGTFIKCIYNGIEKDTKKNNKNFIILYDYEKQSILSYNNKKINNIKLLIYYCYIKARMYKRNKVDGKRIITGGKAEVCYPSFKHITYDIGLTDKIIKKYNDILVELNLIRIANAGLYYYPTDKNKKTYESANTYILYHGNEDTWQEELQESIKFYKQENNNRIFVNTRNYKNNNRQLNGWLGRIKYLIQNGKASNEQIKEYNKIMDVRENNKISIDDF